MPRSLDIKHRNDAISPLQDAESILEQVERVINQLEQKIAERQEQRNEAIQRRDALTVRACEVRAVRNDVATSCVLRKIVDNERKWKYCSHSGRPGLKHGKGLSYQE